MTNDQSCNLARWLWNGGLGLMALALTTGIVLVVVLTLGWNNPRPGRSPDWQAPALPLSLEARANESVLLLLNHPDSEFTFEVEMILLSGLDFDGYGLAYRAQDAVRYYVFAIGSDGYYAVLRVEEDVETVLVSWQRFPHVRRGWQANQLRVTCVGPTCRFYVNDEHAATVEDSTWLTGDVGLWVRSFGGEDVTVEFTNVRTWVEK
jgi:hypothetical protein